MADGYARATGGLGVCMATSGPGATNLTTGIATAYADSSPLLAITGQVPTDMLGNQAFQEAHTFGLMLPIVKHGFRVLDTNDIPVAMNRGCDIAMTGRFGPVLIDLPRDVQNGEICPEMMSRKIPSPSMATDISGLPDALGATIASQTPMDPGRRRMYVVLRLTGAGVPCRDAASTGHHDTDGKGCVP